MSLHKIKHGLGDTDNHDTCTLAQLNALISDATIGASAPPKNYINGLQLSYVGSTQVSVAVGLARSDDDAETMELSGAQTVDITNSGANGLDTGSPTNDSWYYVWLIKNVTSGTVAALLSLSSSSPTMPSGYTKKRLIGSVYRSGSAFSNFLQFGNGNTREYTWPSAKTVLSNGSATTATDVDLGAYAMSAKSQLAKLFMRNNATSTNISTYLRVKGITANTINFLGDNNHFGGTVNIPTDSSQTIQYLGSSSGHVYLYCSGYYEEI